jgi:hypothetical protein
MALDRRGPDVPATQRNFNYYTYVSGDATTYNIRAAVEWAANTATGLAARTTGAPRFITTRSRQPRKFIYRDPTTFRTFSGPVGTAADWAAASEGDIVAVYVPGLATTVNYELVKKVPEKIPTSIVGRQDPDHA